MISLSCFLFLVYRLYWWQLFDLADAYLPYVWQLGMPIGFMRLGKLRLGPSGSRRSATAVPHIRQIYVRDADNVLHIRQIATVWWSWLRALNELRRTLQLGKNPKFHERPPPAQSHATRHLLTVARCGFLSAVSHALSASYIFPGSAHVSLSETAKIEDNTIS
jgi:hypothetical protein